MAKDKIIVSDHPSHHKELARLNIVVGQIQGIQKMIIDNRYCIDIVSQLNAVQSALKSVSVEVLSKHLDTCMVNTDEETLKNRIEEIKSIIKTKY